MRKSISFATFCSFLCLFGCASLRQSPIDISRENSKATNEGPYDPSTLSPDGKIMYFTWAITGIPQIWKVDGPMHFPQQITGAPDANRIWTTSPDGESLIVIRSSAKPSSKSGIVILSRSNGTEVIIPNELACNLQPFWITNDNSKIYYTCFERSSNQTTIYSYAIDSSQSELGARDSKREQIFKAQGQWSVADVQSDQNFLFARAKSHGEADYFEWSPTEKILNPVVGLPPVQIENIRFARNRGEFLIFDPTKNQFFVFNEGRLDKLELKDPARVRSFAIDHRRLHLYVELSDESLGIYDLHFESRSAVRENLPELAAVHAPRVSQTSRYDRYAIISGKSATASYVQIIYDWKDRKPTQWLPSLSFAIPPAP